MLIGIQVGILLVVLPIILVVVIIAIIILIIISIIVVVASSMVVVSFALAFYCDMTKFSTVITLRYKFASTIVIVISFVHQEVF